MRSLYELTSPEVAATFRAAPLVVIPVGSVEQHGPHLPCGTDSIASDLVARALAERLDALYAPFSPYGVTPLHAGHPGTVSLRRTTFEALLVDVCSELVGMGAETVVIVNWHEVNTPSLDAVATDLQSRTSARFYVVQACYVAQRLYEASGGELTHGGGIETLAVMAADPALVTIDEARGASRPEEAVDADAMRRSREVYGFVTDVTEIAPEGWYGDPAWATADRARSFPGAIVDEVARQLESIGAIP
jgi:creatinine amidohydrolase